MLRVPSSILKAVHKGKAETHFYFTIPFPSQYHVAFISGHLKCLELSPKVRYSQVLVHCLVPVTVSPSAEACCTPAVQHRSCFILHQEVLVVQHSSNLRCPDRSLDSASSRAARGRQQRQSPERLDGMACSWPNQKGLTNRQHFCSKISLP